jgi:hypothetical protein
LITETENNFNREQIMNSLSRITYLLYIKIFLFFSAAIFAAPALNTSSFAYANTVLSNGESISVSLVTGEEAVYSIEVPADTTELLVTLSSGSGDLDLYTRYNAPPDSASFDCRPYVMGNNESCLHDSPAQGTWYIMVRGYSSGTTTLKAEYSGGGGAGSVLPLSNDDPISVSLSAGEEAIYSIEVPADTTELLVTLSGDSGDLDLYTRYNAPPDSGSYDCRPYLWGNNESCAHDSPAQGTWYVMVRGYSSGTATLKVKYSEGGETSSVSPLSNGESISVSLSAGEETFYSIAIPSDTTKLRVTLSDGTGDLDLYTRHNAPPNSGSYDCRPYITGSNESCAHDNPAQSTWYIMVRGYSSGTATLKAEYSEEGETGSVPLLSNGEPVPVSLPAGEETFYSIEVPVDTAELLVTLSGGNGDLDLYTRYNAPPDSNSYDCRPYIPGNNEICTHSNPTAGTWYIMVRGYSAGTSTLTATTYTSTTNIGTDSGQLPADKMVWSSWYWPWKDNLNPNLYDNNQALHKYDLYVGGTSDAQGWEYQNHGPPQDPKAWWGHCHAWAAAACWQKQPVQSKTLDDVTFRVRDQKGLMIEAYYDSGEADSHELMKDDPSPGQFWLFLQNEIAGKNPVHGEPTSFIGELYYGDQVWNHPIYAYEVEYSGLGTVTGKITIWYATDFEPYMANSTSLYSDTLTYYFKDVVLSGSTPTNTGEWVLEDGSLPTESASNYSRHRPDAIWRPYKAVTWTEYAENPHLSHEKLSDILGPMEP